MSHQCCSGGGGRPGPKVGVFCTMSPLLVLLKSSLTARLLFQSVSTPQRRDVLRRTAYHPRRHTSYANFSFKSLELGSDFQAVFHRISRCGTTFMSVKSLQFVDTDANVDLEVHVEEHYLAQRCLSCKFFSIQLPAGSPAMPCTL